MKITDEQPCGHMAKLLDREAEGTAPWWIRWFILAHVAHCGPCKRVLLSLRAVLAELKRAPLPPTPADVTERLKEGAWRQVFPD